MRAFFRQLSIFLLAATHMTAVAEVASAAVLYGTTGKGGTASNLYTIDPLTGTTNLIGNVGYAVNGLEVYKGRIWATTSFNDPNFHGLIEIDPITGAGTPVGAGWTQYIVELAFDSSGNAYSWTETSDDLVTIDLTTGTHSAPIVTTISSYSHGLAFDLNNTLYMYNGEDEVWTLDTTTGVATKLYDVDIYGHHGDFSPINGLYYGLSSPSNTPTLLQAFDLTSGTLISSVVLDQHIHTLAWSEVPEPSTAVIATVGLLGMRLARRRRKLD